MGRAAAFKKIKAAELPAVPLKIDLGCGPNKRAGFQGADSIAFPGVDFVVDLRNRWPWEDASVSEAHMSHSIEHFSPMERCHIINELYRVLVVGGTCQVIAPHWASCRAYGDPTHQWSPISEFWFYYLSNDWRQQNAPHTDAKYLAGGFACNFEATWGYSLRPDLAVRNQEFQQFAIANYKETCQDIVATLTKRPMAAGV